MLPRVFVTYVIVRRSVQTFPYATAFSAGVIVYFLYRRARSYAALRRPLNRHSANQGLVTFRLICDRITVFVCVCGMLAIRALDIRDRATWRSGGPGGGSWSLRYSIGGEVFRERDCLFFPLCGWGGVCLCVVGRGSGPCREGERRDRGARLRWW